MARFVLVHGGFSGAWIWLADERGFADRVRKWFFAMPCRKRESMTFDELWRVNLDPKRARGDSLEKADAVGRIAVPGENANELKLTAEDSVFLSALGIRA